LQRIVKQQFNNRDTSVFSSLFCVSVALAAFFCLAIAVWAGPGYLSTVGPAPLRYLPPAKPLEKVTKRVAAVTPPPVVPAAPVAQIEDTNLFAAPDFLSAPTVTEAHSPPKIEQTNLVTGATPDEGTVSTQMLLQYFNTSSNNSGAGVIVPLNVAMPPPVDTPPSRASYTNAP
jgi:hypothetical protein